MSNCRICKKVNCPEGNCKMVNVIFTKGDDKVIRCQITTGIKNVESPENEPNYKYLEYHDYGFTAVVPIGLAVTNTYLTETFNYWVYNYCPEMMGKFDHPGYPYKINLDHYMPSNNYTARKYLNALDKIQEYRKAFFKAFYKGI